MSHLISILNSGESLEKAVVLTKLAFELNEDFYNQYDKITIIYYENLPRKENTFEIHGTIGGLFKNLKEKSFFKYESCEDLWEEKTLILNKLQAKGRISERVKEKLIQDKTHFDKIIRKVPWYFVLEDFKKFLINDFLNLKKVEIKFLDFKEGLDSMFNLFPYGNNGKFYFLDSQGEIGLKTLQKSRQINKYNKTFEPLKRSVILSPNVYTFLLGVYSNYTKDSEIGFRNFNKTQRNSYKEGIELLVKERHTVEEPRNSLFNKLLDKIDIGYGNISTEKKLTLAIYNYLNNLL